MKGTTEVAMKKYAVVVMVDVEHGVNESVGSPGNVEKFVDSVLSRNMGSQNDRGIPLKVKGVQVGRATKVG
jgi:hypothetical protein